MPNIVKIQVVHCPRKDSDVTDEECIQCKFYGGQDAQLLYCDDEPCDTCKHSDIDSDQMPCSVCTMPNWISYQKGENKH